MGILKEARHSVREALSHTQETRIANRYISIGLIITFPLRRSTRTPEVHAAEHEQLPGEETICSLHHWRRALVPFLSVNLAALFIFDSSKQVLLDVADEGLVLYRRASLLRTGICKCSILPISGRSQEMFHRGSTERYPCISKIQGCGRRCPTTRGHRPCWHSNYCRRPLPECKTKVFSFKSQARATKII